MVDLGWPGGMRGGAGGDFEGVRDRRFEVGDMALDPDLTCRLLSTTRAADSIAMRIPPGLSSMSRLIGAHVMRDGGNVRCRCKSGNLLFSVKT